MHIPEVNAFNTDYLNNILRERHHPVDRVLHDELVLPYRFDQIKLKPNDDANATTFNLSMDRVYDNFLYLVSNTKMSPPMDRNYYNRLRTGTPKWSRAFVNTRSYSCVDMIINPAFQTGEWYSVAIRSDKKIRMWTERTNTVFYSNYVDSNKSKTFINPISVCRDNTDHVYILDKGKSGSTSQEDDGPVMYRFNMNGLIQSDPVINQREETKGRELHKYVGGIRADNLSEKERFMDPRLVISDGDFVYVMDVGKSSDNREQVTVKKYDTRLNWIANYSLLNIDTRHPVTVETYGYQPLTTDMLLFNNKFMVVIGNKLNVYDHDFVFEQSVDLTRNKQYTSDGKEFENDPLFLKPSIVNPNILYIIRQQSIEKIYYTRLDTNIRMYPIYKSYGKGNRSITDWTNINNIETYTDKPLLIQNRGDVNIFSHPSMTTIVEKSPGDTVTVGVKIAHQYMYYWVDNEMDTRKQLLYDEFEQQIHTLQQVRVDTEEQINNFVYNKSIGNMLFNMQMFIQNLKGVFAIRGEYVEESTDKYYPSVFEGIHYDIENPVISQGYQPTLDNYVHITEPFVTGVFNRCLYELYKLQLELLDVLQIQWVHEPNSFELKDILAPPCPGGIKTDSDRAMVTDGVLCIMPDDDNDKVDICSMYAITGPGTGSITDANGVCIIYGTKSS